MGGAAWYAGRFSFFVCRSGWVVPPDLQTVYLLDRFFVCRFNLFTVYKVEVPFKLFKQSSRRYSLCVSTAGGSRHVVMVSILSVGGYFVGANGGCQTPCLVISACAVAETALASTPPLRLLRRRVCQLLPRDPALGRPRVGARSVAVVMKPR